MSARRLSAPAGTRLDRTRTISFEFNNREYSGFQGDTLASALFANQVSLVGRSFKLHRPRGVYSCGVEEPTGLVDIGDGARRTPNMRASVVEIYEGMVAQSVNCWPSARFDLGSVNSWFSAMLPAGFYYKTFKWPSWHLFEPAIRRMAGLGRASRERDPDRYEEIAVNPDILVVGGGIAGLAAAIAAAEAGAHTVLLTCAPELGGSAGYHSDPKALALSARVRALGIRVLTRTVAFGIYDHNLVCARQLVGEDGQSPGMAGSGLRECLWKIRARSIIAATGAFERPMVFPDNDRPGVMLAGAAGKFAYGYGVACGSRIVIAANSDLAYTVGSSLHELGVDIVAIVDCRAQGAVQADRRDCGDARIVQSATITAVSGRNAVRGCTVASIDGNRCNTARFDCDLILSAGGWAPAVHFHSQAGGKLRWLDESAMFVPDGSALGVVSVGACAGVFSREAAVLHAHEVGTSLARQTPPPAAPVGGAGRSLVNTHVARRGTKQFIDLQNDVTAADVALAARENYRSVEHLKRYTTIGMGTDQGKTSNINALVLMAEQTGREPAAVGTTRFRPPFAPITMGVLAGRRVGSLYRPLKRLSAQAWHEARGAVFEEYGGWWRPAAYPLPGESIEAAALREASNVRRNAGIFDGSPLGKLEIFGPDAAEFLDLMYVGTLSTLGIGQARYGLLLNENGVIVDDGIVARLGEQRFWVNTTSGGAERTAAAFEEWLQCEFAHLKVVVTPVTSRWSNVTIAGPCAWEWLEAAGFDSVLDPARMKHMTLVSSNLHGMPLRVLRASFSGELGYEINVPANHGRDLFDRLWALSAQISAAPYGIEALQTLRIEKGYIHIGTDTDGTTLPTDIGFGRAMDRKRANFVGRRSLGRPAARDPNRLQLVALTPTDGRTLLPVGAQIALSPPPTVTEGHVTSSAISTMSGQPIALAMLARGAARTGERVRIHHLGKTIEADIVTAPFFDPRGLRQHG
jgi:sarcosine oxidase, subunit alpha